MLSQKEIKIIAGRLFVEEYGRDFVCDNIDRIGTGLMYDDNSVRVDFDISEKNIDEYDDLFHLKGEEHFPELIFSVLVDRQDGSTTILGKSM